MKYLLLLLSSSLLLAGCSVTRLPDNLSLAMMNQENPAIVADGAPAYLLMLDALVLTYPENKGFLLAGSRLYGAYASVFSKEEDESRRMANKSFDYARRALCEYDIRACELVDGNADDLDADMRNMFDQDDIETFYVYASAWAGWIQANSDDWNAIAQLGKVKTLMKWVARQDEGYDHANVQVYLGVLESQLPPSVGGKPEIGRAHFERAIELTEGRNLMAKVLFAEQYGRLMFEQDLHDQLLQEVIEADPEAEGLTLINRLAQQQALDLLASSSEYFE
ncbi:MAG: TRAP transporter TatT component family protein [Oleibacter sp.]|nr:TRAP transporter TatT component family protein [Thalassolituus sp.]